ncbi:tRNA epoxyqueuosine(34) reductase QueG [Brevibacillus sp. HB1.2]|uniref:tRNA epoxyqueuosine(34) reductase QueG n=1 Tax=Brevibacillus porteri TaxID=2126350 RepID=A0ABX5FH56_9BACL|nr:MULTISPECIES: tRNA epoxyqueuosine(34) reductase QueG [Brevibacillus]ATF11569.1 tRNA epoxyqueuosine(34) reductase QueG [Brevibacillus brevis X23]NTU22915.1 tRNA epoxyqueuosine(34) reductase QueG [Brevibacillus sp. HB1.2]MDC0765231.1 tRNA epoxyqueuosine(34) reductase QueG [Brevibacillus sp. AG]MED1799512.1 tRNA epoxyqueuosine(34) reductase QueG [Brevibacillus porteri]MED2133286.1 tRNA epoxyqueuosine(34) reductase QueG [Brevibacillus porteri]
MNDLQYWEQTKQSIIDYAKEIGIDKIGFASADPFTTLKERLLVHREKGYESGFEEPDLEKRTNPELLLDGARSLISIALAYPSKLKNPPKSEPGAYRGILCRAAWGTDYHHVLRDKLDKLTRFIMELEPGARIESMVDTGALSDRAVAERAGIGFVGKNCAIITPEFGSWVYLGELVTNLPLPSDLPIEEGCGDCNICVDACPTGALIQGGQLDAQRCVAYLTQVKDFIPDEFRGKIGNRLYGCDTCQTVCPKNRRIDNDHHAEFQPDPEIAKPLLIPLLQMSNKEFKEKFGLSSSSWRGKKPIQRNAILALAHFKDRTAVPHLERLLFEDPRPVIRGTAAWALGKIGGEQAQEALISAKAKEASPEVVEEIEKGMSMIRAQA